MTTNRILPTILAGVILWYVAGSAVVLGEDGAQSEAPKDPAVAKQSKQQIDEMELRGGKNFIPTKVYSAEEDAAILEMFQGLRVADVCDAMDQVGLRNVGVMSPEIRPAWKDPVNLSHRFVGVAITVRYVPHNMVVPSQLSPEEFNQWSGKWYANLSPEPFVELIRPGTVVVIDDANGADVGSIGSNNIMGWKKRGCVAVVTDATARDLDEIALERIPLYFRGPGRGIRPGRNLIESVNRPVEVGGVLVRPGDIVLGDADGVIVVPREYAEQVAAYARATLEKDKAARRNLYRALGIPDDVSVQ
ncbi:MAG: RraA family protein [Thermogutta sp.]|nr:RraA family protein [Thermogutta sp.]HOP78208.1 RraA family protein [Thermogutta sp.]HPU07652.1 RraA family protein [Thermogutta sp.]HQF15394.1 RraA family protein [Thermogutta sp.]